MERQDYLSRPILENRLRLLKKVGWVLTGAVLLLVVLMRGPYKIPLPDGVTMSVLPPTHAALNSLAALFLCLAVIAVKRGNIAWHRRWMTSALVVSTLFLLCYVAYHFTTVETRFGGTGWQRRVYFFLLITHIIAAAISFPFILRSFIFAWCNDFQSHRRLVRWVFPVWLYVAVTGPICYFMLKPYY